QDTHADEVGAMDAFVGCREHRPYAEQPGPLGRPVAGRAGAVVGAGQDHERDALILVGHRGVVDAHLFAVGPVLGDPALDARHQLVAQPYIGEGAADHHVVVAAA